MIHAVVHDLVAALIMRWNNKNAAALSALFAEDADFVDIVGNQVHGRPEIEALHRIPFTGVLRNAVLTVEKISLQDLASDLAVCDVRWRNAGAGLPGRTLPDQFGNLFLVIRAKEGAAQFVLGRNANFTGDLNRRG